MKYPNLLILDDDSRFRTSLKLSLKDCYSVYEAENLTEALSCLQNQEIDALLLDFALPGDNGHRIFDEIRSKGFNQPIIVISGFVEVNMCVGFLKRQIQGFFEKPFQVKDLKNKLIEIGVGDYSLKKDPSFSSRLEPSLENEKINKSSREIASNLNSLNPTLNTLTLDSNFSFKLLENIRSIEFNGVTISLTKTEFEILKYFTLRPRKKVSREELILNIWKNSHQSKHNLDTHLLNLRKKVPFFSQNLKLIYGEGYCYLPPSNN